MATCSSCKWFSYEPHNGRSTPYCGYHNNFSYAYADKFQCNAYSPRGGSSNSSSGDGCFLTSACIKARNLPDDCEELTIMREFRNTYLNETETGKALIKEYYEIAPGIVEKINKQPDANSIYEHIYEDVLSCIKKIKNNQYEDAVSIYRSMVLRVDSI